MAQYNRQNRTPVGGVPPVQKQLQQSQPGQPSLPSQQQQQMNNQKRQMQQFYLHKSFDLSSDAEFLPSIPSDPVATALQLQESMNHSYTNQYGPNMNMLHRTDQMPYYGAQAKARRYSGQFLQQHLFGGKRNDYAQYKSGS